VACVFALLFVRQPSAGEGGGEGGGAVTE
jgi:hypothetical protein